MFSAVKLALMPARMHPKFGKVGIFSWIISDEKVAQKKKGQGLETIPNLRDCIGLKVDSDAGERSTDPRRRHFLSKILSLDLDTSKFSFRHVSWSENDVL